MDGSNNIDVIRRALADTIVYYYPYAGKLVEGPGCELRVNCTAEGVAFVEADAEVTIEQLGDTIQPSCLYQELLLKDVVLGSGGILGCPLMLLQATRLKCGGLVLVILFNHVMSDALGSIQFITTMIEMAKGLPTPSTLPIWRRDLLTSRHPPCVAYAHPKYELDGKVVDIPSSMVRRSFHFGPKEIKAIRSNLPPEAQSTSTFDMITACVWRSRTQAMQYNPNDILRITCLVNARGKNFIGLPHGYYGNALISPAKVTKANTLSNSSLEHVMKIGKSVNYHVQK